MERTIEYLKRGKISQPTETDTFMMVTLGKIRLEKTLTFLPKLGKWKPPLAETMLPLRP